MTSFVKAVTWDCGNALRLARFRAAALGTDVDEEVERLTGLGAATVERFESHVVMRDPEGNEFCVEPGPADGLR